MTHRRRGRPFGTVQHVLTAEHARLAADILRAGRGWAAAIAAVNAARPESPPASQRTIRRALHAHGVFEDFPVAWARKGGRPRKKELTDDEFRFALTTIAAARGPAIGLADAAAGISQERITELEEKDPESVREARVSPRWLERALRARGWVPAPRPEPRGRELVELEAMT